MMIRIFALAVLLPFDGKRLRGISKLIGIV
jgi:hypothetical protein